MTNKERQRLTEDQPAKSAEQLTDEDYKMTESGGEKRKRSTAEGARETERNEMKDETHELEDDNQEDQDEEQDDTE